MPSALSLYEKFGALGLPLADSTAGTFTSLDPGRDVLLNVFAAALNDELAAVWTAALLTPLENSAPVKTKFGLEPNQDLLGSTKVTFPALFVYRSTETAATDEHTLWQERITQPWGVDYMLGPLTAGDDRKFRDVLIAAVKIIKLTVRRGGHRAYAETNGVANLVLIGPPTGFSTVRVVNFQLGRASFSEAGPAYHSLSLRLETTELDGFVDGADGELSGMSLDIQDDGTEYHADTEA